MDPPVYDLLSGMSDVDEIMDRYKLKLVAK